MFEYEDHESNSDSESVIERKREEIISESIKPVYCDPEPQVNEIITKSHIVTKSPAATKSTVAKNKSNDKKFLNGSSSFDELESQNNSSSQEDEPLSADDIEELKELIKNWLDLDEKAKILSDEMKDLKMEKKQYETYILGFMDKTNKDVIKTNDSTLRKDVKETKGSPKEEHILKTLTKILENAEQAYKITQQIIEEIPSKEVISLKKDKGEKKNPKRTKKFTKKHI
jgi:predicted transcriptional regulator